MKNSLSHLAILLALVISVRAQQPATTAPHAAHAPAKPAPSPDAIWANLMAGNQRFVAGKPQSHALLALRKKLASGQQPHTIVLSCSDSRVSPELVFDQSLGDLFVVRSAGNIADPVGLGSIEYAVDHLHSTVLVVLDIRSVAPSPPPVRATRCPAATWKRSWTRSIPPSLKRKPMPRPMI